MPLISHEIPPALIENYQDQVSDYMFALLHKLIDSTEYFRLVTEYRDAGGVVFLDNSCFELGASLDNDLLYKTYDIVRPDIVILPDVLGNADATVERTLAFIKEHPDVIDHAMAVPQGSSFDELIECYKLFRDFRLGSQSFAMIGIPFVYPWLEKEPYFQANERIRLLNFMDREGIIDRDRKHHLLGTWQAREFAEYSRYNWIYSLDTSNPVMAAIDGDRYGPRGINEKPRANLDSSWHLTEEDIDMDLLMHNVKTFREIVNG